MRAWAIWGCTYRAIVWLMSLYVLYLVTLLVIVCLTWRYGGGM